MSDWRVAGHEKPTTDDWCQRPVRMVNVVTGDSHLSRCKSTRTSRCEYCARLHRGDVAAIGRSGWTDNPGDRAYWITLTAPGSDQLPWDKSVCGHGPDDECSGSDGCKVDENAAALWHDGLPQRWSWFVTEVRRQCGDGVDVQFMKVYEWQERGVLHIHVMVRVVGVISDRRFRAALRLARQRQNFGRQMKVEAVNISDSRSAARVAGYVAKYCTKSADDLVSVRRIDSATGVIRNSSVRPWSASQRWGLTKRQISQQRCQWATLRAVGAPARPRSGGASAGAAGAGLDLNQHRYAGSVSPPAVPVPSGVR